MNTLRWALTSTREKGLITTAKIAGSVILDLHFDLRHGTSTMGWVERDAIDTPSPNKAHSAPYRATKARPLNRLLRSLPLPHDCTFVDIGSGKGRVLLIASRFGFRRVVGIDFSEPLCELARANVGAYARTTPLRSPVDVVQADATTYPFNADERVFFLFNPFDRVVLEQVLGNLRRSLSRDPRKVWLIYNTPLDHDVVRRASIFTHDALYEIGGTFFRVYTNGERVALDPAHE